jgi:hypothetical protein
MSTVLIVIAREGSEGGLKRFLPVLRAGETEARKVSMKTEIHDWLFDEQDRAAVQLKAAIRAHLGEFVRGSPIDDLDFMKRVEDRRKKSYGFLHGVWSIRPNFRPQYRLFGFFVTKDWFIVLSKQRRDDLARSDEKWHAEIDRCKSSWEAMFPGRQAWTGDDVADFVSSNMEKRDDRW